MRVFDTVPDIGTIFDWDIDEIMTRDSCDLALEHSFTCLDCDRIHWDGDYSDDGFWDGPCDHDNTRPATPEELWPILLDHKRQDRHYEDVLNSLLHHGFVRPLTAAAKEGPELRLGDGHHRLAAAIELGMSSVPVEVFGHYFISGDAWHQDGNIATVNKRRELTLA